MLFHPDALTDQLPASADQVERLAQRALEANGAAGTGFALLVLNLDGYADWKLRLDQAFADGLFRAVLEQCVQGQESLVCGRREGGLAYLYLQGVSLAEAKAVGERCLLQARHLNLSGRGGPTRLALSLGGAHSAGFRTKQVALQLPDLVRAAERGARLAVRSGGDRSAWIERFGAAPSVSSEAPGGDPSSHVEEGAHSVEESGAAAAASEAPQELQEIVWQPPSPEDAAAAWKALPQVDLEADLEALLVERYGDAFSNYLHDRDESWERRVERLERRIEKLGNLLEHEQSRQRAAARSQGEDAGLASRFRTVQGLDEQDQQFEAKQGLMAALYEANLKLRGGDPRSQRGLRQGANLRDRSRSS